MHQDMSREEFLKLAGAGFLGIIGVTSLLHNLSKFIDNPNHQKHSSANTGYGSNPYGK
jgi:hypothetical protein